MARMNLLEDLFRHLDEARFTATILIGNYRWTPEEQRLLVTIKDTADALSTQVQEDVVVPWGEVEA